MRTKYGSALLCPNGYYQIKSTKEGNKDKYLHRLIFEDYYGVTLLDESIYPKKLIDWFYEYFSDEKLDVGEIYDA